MSEDLANIIGQATAEYDVFPLRLLGGPRELFIKYRLATRMTNRYRGTLLEDWFYFLL